MDEQGVPVRFEVSSQGDQVVVDRFRGDGPAGVRQRYTALEAANFGAALLRASGVIEHAKQVG